MNLSPCGSALTGSTASFASLSPICFYFGELLSSLESKVPTCYSSNMIEVLWICLKVMEAFLLLNIKQGTNSSGESAVWTRATAIRNTRCFYICACMHNLCGVPSSQAAASTLPGLVTSVGGLRAEVIKP
jgi:hypothetical protein